MMLSLIPRDWPVTVENTTVEGTTVEGTAPVRVIANPAKVVSSNAMLMGFSSGPFPHASE